MKATINGVAVEGTPKEVWELIQQADAQGTNLKPVSPMPNTIDYDWVRGLPQITSGDSPLKKCTQPCFCTGQCTRSQMGKLSNSFDILNNYTQKWDNPPG